MRQYPIYNRVTGQGKASSADFGSREGFTQQILVGSGSQNSHELGQLDVRRWTDTVGRVHFEVWFDNQRIKHGVYEPTTKEFKLVAVKDGLLVGAFAD